MRSDIEFVEPVKYTKEYYLGYVTAYENIARRLIESEEIIEKIKQLLKENKLLKEIMILLLQNGCLETNRIANYIGITAEKIDSILYEPDISKVGVFSYHNIGDKKVYSLSLLGKNFIKNYKGEL